MKVYYDRDADLSALKGKKIAVIGFGSQGHAHALNLRDSGMDVCVGLGAKSPSREKAAKQGLQVFDTAAAAKRADVIMMLVPDEMGSEIYEAEIAPHLSKGKYLAFGHGFNIHFKFIKPPADVNVFMIAPKGPGHLVRSEYTKGRGVPCLLAVEQDPSGDTAKVGLAYGSAIGGGRAAIDRVVLQRIRAARPRAHCALARPHDQLSRPDDRVPAATLTAPPREPIPRTLLRRDHFSWVVSRDVLRCSARLSPASARPPSSSSATIR